MGFPSHLSVSFNHKLNLPNSYRIMKTLTGLMLGLSLLAATANAQSILSQYFNNNNPSFTDSQSSLYNWSVATANSIPTEPNNISAGNTKTAGTELTGEEFRGRGFLFVLPGTTGTPEGTPGASLMYTTHLGTSTILQNNPQPDWFQDGPLGIAGRLVNEIVQIQVRTLPVNQVVGRIGLQLNGTDWVVSAASYLLSNAAWTEYTFADLASGSWYTGVFSGGVLDADVTDNPMISLSGSEVVTGYAMYFDTEGLAGSAARVRMDYMRVSVVPEPATYGALLGLLVLGVVAYRRRR